MNKLFTKIATSFVGIAMAIGVGVAVAGNSEATQVQADVGTAVRTCDFTAATTGNSNYGNTWTYASDYSVTGGANNSKAWAYCKFGGKGGSSTSSTKSLTSSVKTGPITNQIAKFSVVINSIGTQSNVTVTSSYLYVYSDSGYSTQIDRVSLGTTYSASGTLNATPTSGDYWAANSYYKWEITSTIKGKSNIGVCIDKLVWYQYTAPVQTYTVSFAVNTAGYGTVSQSSITGVPSGTSISTSNNTVTINGTTVTATPATNTAQYTYAFTGWSNNTGTVTAARTITANFSRTTNTFTVDGSNITHGSLDNTSNIEYDGDLDLNIVPESGYTYPSSVSVTMGGNDISNDVEYENGYLYYSPVRGDIVITATCPVSGNTYSITTTVTNGTYSGDTTITDNGGVASVTIVPTGDYKLPTSVSVSGADHVYNDSTGVISLSNATGNVTISAAMDPLTEYSITVYETNGSHTGASTIKESRSVSLTFTPDSGWGQPADVTVTGASYTWTRSSGVLALSNPNGNVTVTYAAAGNELTSITLSANSGNYILGADFIKPTVTAQYTVAADADVTNSPNLVVTGYDPYTTGTQPVTIKYTEGGIQKTASYTATVNAKSVETITTWEATTLSQLTADDVFVIVGNNGSNYAMTNDNGTASAPGVTAVTISNNKLSADPAANLQWNISGNSTDGYTFYPNGSTTTWLYCTSTNNGVRVGTNNDKTFTISDEGYLFHTGTSRYVGIYNSSDWRCYTSINANIQNQTFSYFKKVETQVGTASLIRIVCDPAIDPDTGYKGGDKFVGDKVYTTDFAVKKQYDTGTTLEDVTGFTINGGEEVELTSTSNTITVSYTEGGIPKSAEVVVAATERAAELESVQLVEKGLVKKSGYIDFASATWNLDNIYVHYYWSDDDYDTEVTLASLVATNDASISPIKPTVGATSFTVSYEYLEIQITNNTVTLTEAVRSDYVSSMYWGNTTGAQFKHFSGEQLTEEIVNSWNVKATYAGAGEGSRLYWGDYDLYIGSKQITSLPYTWLSEDDGQALSIHYGEDIDGNEFVKTNATAVGNVCATINAIDHDETITGDQTITLDMTDQSAYSKTGTSGTGSETEITLSGFTVWTDKGYAADGESMRVYSGGEFKITSENTIKSVSFTFTGGKTGLAGGADLSTNEYTETASAQARVVSITIEYEGSVTTTVHYANQMEHFDAQKKVVEFAKFMNNTMNGTNVCSGTFVNLESAWEDVADKYDALFGASTTLDATELAWAKNMLKYATAAWGSEAENACVEKAMKTYEWCTSHYKDICTPFMYEEDGVTPLRSINISEGFKLFNIQNSSTILIVSVVSLVSIAAVGGYFFLRKKKED